jgi:hypothetical protein
MCIGTPHKGMVSRPSKGGGRGRLHAPNPSSEHVAHRVLGGGGGEILKAVP